MQKAFAEPVAFASMDQLTAAVRRQFALAEGSGAVGDLRAGAALGAAATEICVDTLSDAELFVMLQERLGAQPCSATDRRLRRPVAGGIGPEERFRRPSPTKAGGAAFSASKKTARLLRPKPRVRKCEHAATGARDDPIGAPPGRSRNRLGATPGVALSADKTTARLLRSKLRALQQKRAATGVPNDPIGAPFGRGRNRLGGTAIGAARAAGPASEPVQRGALEAASAQQNVRA